MEQLRRLYFILPNIESARTLYGEVVRANVDSNQIQFVRHRGRLSKGLPEASQSEKTDVLQGAMVGLLAGACSGFVAYMVIAHFYLPEGSKYSVLYMALGVIVGALLGLWAATLIGSALPNSKFTEFQTELDEGKVLMMVDVPQKQVDDVSTLSHKYPDVVMKKQEAT
jgi:hypothetical protein